MIERLTRFPVELLSVLLEASFWLVVGLLVAGLIKALFPAGLLNKWLRGSGGGTITLAALIGTPLPLCSCSVVPTAVALRREGASKGATVSFLIATPENGADSIALSYALLGPFMTIVRPVAAIISAVFAGLLTSALEPRPLAGGEDRSSAFAAKDENRGASGCCSSDTGKVESSKGLVKRLSRGMYYSFIEIFDDIFVWLAVGLLLAAAMNTFLPPDSLARWGSGLPAMLLMLLIGFPMYICATASTPVAASMLLAGISPGTVLVFLLAGPATNIGTIGIVRRELGNAAAATYLLGMTTGAVALGLLTDAAASFLAIDITAQVASTGEIIPGWLAWLSLVVLAAFAGRYFLVRFGKLPAKKES